MLSVLGELLFVPAGSPHYVENLGQTIAISANYVDSSNLTLVKEELGVNALLCDRAATLLKEISSPEFPVKMNGNIGNLTWKEFKQWPKTYGIKSFMSHDICVSVCESVLNLRLTLVCVKICWCAICFTCQLLENDSINT